MKFYIATFATLLVSVISVAQSKDFKTAQSLEIQYNILNELKAGFVDSINTQDLINRGIDAMLESLDPYTEYIRAENDEDLELMTTATYGGIGSLIKKVDSIGVIISQPYAGSPAIKFGLEPGDVILKIDGEDVMPLTADQCSSKMKGQPGTNVVFTVRKARGGEVKDYTITRERIHIPDISYSGIIDKKYSGDKKVGYIKIDGFTANGSKDVKSALASLKKEGAESIILDLRGNGGGLMDEAIKIVSLFVPKGTVVVSQKGRYEKSIVEYKTLEEPVDTLIPLTVMVNSGSASSSEIVAGAIQDLDRGIIVGTRTFGKGLVQTIRPVGYDGSVKLTIAKYYTPSGRCVQAIDYSNRNSDGSVGVVPDSLKKPFLTKNGRTVYDGGGITPDSVITLPPYSRTALSLVMNDIINDYALKYYASNLSISPAGEFELSDSEYEEFIEYAASRNFDSRTAAQVEFERMVKSAKNEDLYEMNKAEFEALSNKINLSKEQLLRAKKEEIKPLIEEEIAHKFYFSSGRIESIIRNDEQLKKAIAY
ncbi:MAG: S41 family peptidase [Bacteroidales bacterium]|nr:S41 family peptidase [Bacteroidales bacterium]